MRKWENMSRKKWLHSTYGALDAIIRDHFVDFVASVVLPGSEDIIQFEKIPGESLKTNWELMENNAQKLEIRYYVGPGRYSETLISLMSLLSWSYYRLHSPGSSITWLLGLLGDKKGVIRSYEFGY